MLISLNELKKLVDIKISDDDLFKLIGSRLVEIEGVEDWSKKFKKIYIVKVKTCEPIEGTHLHLCTIDAGEKLNAEIDPEHPDYVQVVCGAPNVHADMFAVWIAPGAIVPATYNTSEPFEISARELRGFMSYGMLAGADELSLGEDHSGIVELDPSNKNIIPGASFAEVFDLNDKIIEVENKSLTHRPDCFGLVGFAREIAGILGQPFNSDYDSIDTTIKTANKNLAKSNIEPTPLSVKISDYSICPRYLALLFDFKKLPARSPYLCADDIFLFKAGMRPVSPLVDLTNIIMLKTGQPLHAFDYDKFIAIGKGKAPEITVRLARKGEKLTLLDDKEVELNQNDIIIASNDVPVALAGAMGGKSTEIDESTQKVLLEIASFSLYNLRKTQMSHGIFSEAITRFTKGRSPLDLEPAAADALESFKKLGGEYISAAVNASDSVTEEKLPAINITTQEINNLLGSNYPTELIIQTLENTEFVVNSTEKGLEITAPRWRTDIHIKEDIIEEVGRLLGFDNLPLSYPLRPFVAASVDPLLTLKSKIRSALSDRLGANEVLTYSFVSKKLQEKAGESVENSYRITNSISPELECFRQSLIPSLLEKSFENEKAGYKNFSLYELNQVAQKSFGFTEEGVPALRSELALVTSGDFYHAKTILLELQKSLHLDFTLKPVSSESKSLDPTLEPLRSLEIYIESENQETLIGALGELKRTVKKAFKLSEVCSALKIQLDPCISAKNSQKSSIKISRYPSVSRDLTFKVPEETPYSAVESALISVLKAEPNLVYALEPTSIYKKPIKPTKNISFHLSFASEQKTLTSEEISVIIEKITNALSAVNAEIV